MRRQLTSTVWNWASSMEAMLWQGLPHGGVQVVYDIRYGPRLRNTLDIYMPPDLALDSNAAESSNSSSSSSSSNEGSKGRPVLFFVHGGVWASGEKWMYSPLAIRFAQSGAVVVTIQYTLYPEALAIEQVEETSRALSWAMDHIHEYGGDPSRIFLTGHSSGAHVCSMVVWRRLRSALRRMFQAHGKDVASPPTAVAEGDSSSSSGGGGSGSSNSREGELPHYTLKGEDLWSLDEPDLRQPYCFLGMSGVYDIAHHQRHEQARGVFALSAMSPAIGGPARFVASSPALLFDALASAAAAAAAAAAEAAAAGAVGGAAANSAVGDASAAAASFGASFDCPKSPLLTATAARTTATASAPSAPSTSAAARSRALEQLAAVSAAAAASLRPSLSAALKSASPHSIATSAGPNAASEGPDASQLVPLSGGPRSVKPSTDFGKAISNHQPAASKSSLVSSSSAGADPAAARATGIRGDHVGASGAGMSVTRTERGSEISGGENPTSVADAVNRATSKEVAKQALRSHLLKSSAFNQSLNATPAAAMPPPASSLPASSPLQPAQEFTVPPPFSVPSSSYTAAAAAAAATVAAGAAPTGEQSPPAGNALSPPSNQEASSSQEADPLSSDCFSSRFLAPSPPSPLDILRQELGAGVAESVVAALASGQLTLLSSPPSSSSSPSSSTFPSSSSSSRPSSTTTSSSASPIPSSPAPPSSTPLLPIILLQCSTADYVVPPETSLSLIRSLQHLNSFLLPSPPPSLLKLGGEGGGLAVEGIGVTGEGSGGVGAGVGIRAKALVYDDAGHPDFACWAVRGERRGRRDGEVNGGEGSVQGGSKGGVSEEGKEEEGEWKGGMLMRSKSMRKLSHLSQEAEGREGDSGTKDGEEGDEVAEQVLSSGGASDEMACVRDSLDIVTGRVSLEDMVWQ